MHHDANLRVRFAPSPTGYLHTGGARTALYNWLMARQAGGRFILRIEDTDEQRSTEESTRAILDGLAWLGIDWDEGPHPDPAHFGESIGERGPYFQSQRAGRHLEYVQQLLAAGHAFYCPATEDEMASADGKKLLFSPYRDLPMSEQQERLAAAGGRLPVRFKCPRGEEVAWTDIVRGRVSFQSDELGDFIFVKSSGKPLYNFAVVCDDADMGITHVLRGEDHISNTPKQILLYQALGLTPPAFGHAPLILGMDRARLSKRHGATKVGAYRELGVLPEALANFLLLIGWAPKDNKELFTRAEMIEYFNAADIGKSSGAFNMEKLTHMNGLYIRSLSPAEFFARVKPYLPPGWVEYRGEEYAQAALKLFQDKLTMLGEVEQHAWYFFRAPQHRPADADPEASVGYFNEGSVAKFITGNPDAPQVLGRLRAILGGVPAAQWDQAHLEPLVESFCEATGLGKSKVMQPWRVALTGDKISPGFYDVLSVMGKDEVLRRVQLWVSVTP